MQTFNIQLPFFPGFYETDLENSDTGYWAIQEELDYYQRDYCSNWGPGEPWEQPVYEQLTEDDLDFDYKAYEQEVIEGFIDAWTAKAPDIVMGTGNPTLDSPRYYNYRNDELYADVDLVDDWKDRMRKFIKENHEWLKERVHEDWTSYDGFCSFMENDIDKWDEHLYGEEDERYIGCIIGYMMYLQNKEIRHDLVMDALEDVYAGSYVYITDEGKAKIEELKSQITPPDPNQLEIPFEW